MNDTISPLSSLDLPGRIQKLLEDSGITTVGDLAARLEEDPKSILAIGGVGPKTLLDISAALEAFENGPDEQYLEPVQSLGDQFKSTVPEEPVVIAGKAGDQEKKEKKDKGKKSEKNKKKQDKKPKKSDKKKKKSKKPANKKGKNSKKGKDKKAKKSKKK